MAYLDLINIALSSDSNMLDTKIITMFVIVKLMFIKYNLGIESVGLFQLSATASN